MLTLYIVRGLPGSGKSTLAEKLVGKERHREADMYHQDPDGNYIFDPAKVQEAHKWCQDEMWNLLHVSPEDCAVSNTFTCRWEYQPYIDMANDYGFTPVVVSCSGNRTSVHDIPAQVMEKMLNRWEPHVEGSI